MRVPDCCKESVEFQAVLVVAWNEENYINVFSDADAAVMTLVLASGEKKTIFTKHCPFCGVYLGGETCVEVEQPERKA